MNPIEFLIVAWSYRLLRDNVGRCGPVFAAAAQVYAASYDSVVMSRFRSRQSHRDVS